eukprot:Opistho-2@3325
MPALSIIGLSRGRCRYTERACLGQLIRLVRSLLTLVFVLVLVSLGRTLSTVALALRFAIILVCGRDIEALRAPATNHGRRKRRRPLAQIVCPGKKSSSTTDNTARNSARATCENIGARRNSICAAQDNSRTNSSTTLYHGRASRRNCLDGARGECDRCVCNACRFAQRRVGNGRSLQFNSADILLGGRTRHRQQCVICVGHHSDCDADLTGFGAVEGKPLWLARQHRRVGERKRAAANAIAAKRVLVLHDEEHALAEAVDDSGLKFGVPRRIQGLLDHRRLVHRLPAQFDHAKRVAKAVLVFRLQVTCPNDFASETASVSCAQCGLLLCSRDSSRHGGHARHKRTCAAHANLAELRNATGDGAFLQIVPRLFSRDV